MVDKIQTNVFVAHPCVLDVHIGQFVYFMTDVLTTLSLQDESRDRTAHRSAGRELYPALQATAIAPDGVADGRPPHLLNRAYRSKE